MPEATDKVLINGKEYKISKLRCKHLRQLSEVLAVAKEEKAKGEAPGLYASLERWMPFIIDSIKVNHPEFGQAEVDDMTMDEVLYVWNAITAYSSVTFTSGETKPAEQTTNNRESVEPSQVQ